MGVRSLELLRTDPAGRDPVGAVRPAASGAEQASGLVAGAAAHRVRIVDAALGCIARQGLAKTTLDDVARAAGCSRATVYRAFPGGKDAVVRAVVDTEVSRLLTDLALAVGESDTLENALVTGMALVATRISGHAALGFLLEHEPEVVLPHLAFDHHDALLIDTSVFVAPFLGRWLGHDEATRVAEWCTRIVLSYASAPDPEVDLTDLASARRFVRTYVLPGVSVLAAGNRLLAGAASDRPPVHRPVPHAGRTASKGEAS